MKNATILRHPMLILLLCLAIFTHTLHAAQLPDEVLSEVQDENPLGQELLFLDQYTQQCLASLAPSGQGICILSPAWMETFDPKDAKNRYALHTYFGDLNETVDKVVAQRNKELSPSETEVEETAVIKDEAIAIEEPENEAMAIEELKNEAIAIEKQEGIVKDLLFVLQDLKDSITPLPKNEKSSNSVNFFLKGTYQECLGKVIERIHHEFVVIFCLGLASRGNSHALDEATKNFGADDDPHLAQAKKAMEIKSLKRKTTMMQAQIAHLIEDNRSCQSYEDHGQSLLSLSFDERNNEAKHTKMETTIEENKEAIQALTKQHDINRFSTYQALLGALISLVVIASLVQTVYIYHILSGIAKKSSAQSTQGSSLGRPSIR